ncbi:MAG: single-stranded-DNA-specific exonuclease RecJ [Anaerolineae bacterium]
MTQRHWIEPSAVTAPAALRTAVGGHPLVADILTRRGLADPAAAVAFLDWQRYVPAPPEDLPGVTPAADLLWQAIRQRKRLAVWGDFDVDGQTATTLLVDALRELGAQPLYVIPHRLNDGHGIKLPTLEKLLAQGVDLLLTCDTGVAEHEAIALARARGVQVIVTDHHDLPPDLPRVEALVEPKLLARAHPLRELPGVGVAFILMQALYSRAGRPGAEARLLDLVALGIVADVARQVGDTRYLLQRGLLQLRQSPRLGLQALMAQANLDPLRVDAETIGFQLGPRLNALGRLADATQAVELLTTTDATTARILAAQLEGLNNERKLLCDQVEAAAQEMLAREPSLLDGQVLVLLNPHWHPGVLGIVANRLAEQYRRPALLLTQAPDGLARGSARSVPGVDLGATIAANAHLIERFGGHAGAAGLTVRPERVPELRRALSNTIATMRTTPEDAYALALDAVLPLQDLSLPLVQELNRLAPFGEGNPPVTLATFEVTVKGHRLIGRNRRHRKLTIADAQGHMQDVVWWGGADADLPEGTLDVAYTLAQNEYRGDTTLQLVMRAVRLRRPAAVEVTAAPAAIPITDLRGLPDPLAEVRRLLNSGEPWQIWGEGHVALEGPVRDRRSLDAGRPLIIWSAPPGRAELERVLERVAPPQLALVNLATAEDRLELFLRNLLGMAKYAITRRGGELHVPAVAAGLGQRELAVRRGLAWLELFGRLQVVSWQTGDRVRLAPAMEAVEAVEAVKAVDRSLSTDGAAQETTRTIAQAELQALLAEAAAFRAFCRRAPIEAWMGERPG